MDLSGVFQKAVKTAFIVFSGQVKKGKYIVTPVESGWEEVVVPVEYGMDVIVNGLSQEDKANTSFFNQIQSSDTIIMAKGVDIKSTVVKVKNADKFHLLLDGEWEVFNIINHETDPAEALFLILLRKGNL